MTYCNTSWLLLALCSITSISSVSFAAPLPLQQAEQFALQHSPALDAADQRSLALQALPDQVESLPDPSLSLRMVNVPVDSFSSSQSDMTQIQFGLSQALPFPGKLALQAKAASKRALAAARNRDEVRLTLLRNVRVVWWNIAYLDRALQLLQRNEDALRFLIGVAEAKYKTGSGLQQDVLLAQLELSHLLDKTLTIQAERQRSVARLNALLGRDPTIAVQLPDQLPALVEMLPNQAQLIAQAADRRPLLQALAYEVDAADAFISLADKDYYPDFTLGALYGFRQGNSPISGQARPDMASINLSMTLPIFTGTKQDQAKKQRLAEKEQARFEWQQAQYQVAAEINAAASDVAINRQQLSLFEQGILPQSRQTTASMLAGYKVDKVDFLNLVRAQLTEYNNNIQYWRIYASAAQAQARLAAAAGYE